MYWFNENFIIRKKLMYELEIRENYANIITNGTKGFY